MASLNVDAVHTLLVNGFRKDTNPEEYLILEDLENNEGNTAIDLASYNEGLCHMLFQKEPVEVLVNDPDTGLYEKYVALAP